MSPLKMSLRIVFTCVAVVCITPTQSIDSIDSINHIEKQAVQLIDEWDAKHPTYNLIGEWLSLKRIANASEHQKERNFLSRMASFFRTHRVDVKMTSDDFIESRSSKLKKFFMPFVVLMVLKKTIEVPILLIIVALLAFKGLSLGLMAFMVSAATAFKSMLEHHSSSKVSYEVVPQINHWSRSGVASPSSMPIDVDYPNIANYHTIPMGTK